MTGGTAAPPDGATCTRLLDPKAGLLGRWIYRAESKAWKITAVGKSVRQINERDFRRVAVVAEAEFDAR